MEWSVFYLVVDGVFSLDDLQVVLVGIMVEFILVDVGFVVFMFKGDKFWVCCKVCWNFVFFQIFGGDLILFYKIGLKVVDWSGWLVCFKDGGKIWS